MLDHIGLEEMENDVMRTIEASGHESRMMLAYSRQVAGKDEEAKESIINAVV